MQMSASPEQTAAVETALETANGVRSSRFVSRDEALGEAEDLFRDRSDLVGISAAALPESFRVVLRRGVGAKAAAAELQALPGVDEVSRPALRPAYC
ncbi:MAG TPA: permease-like cell division protein FtsX [Acidimicrobiia bacterium]|nr:permease-like cell division protein FtsX [Acidimicrobiia bacterium]